MSGPRWDDPTSIEMVAAALRADRTDVAAYARVLSTTLGEMLPAGMVELQRKRSLVQRITGRDGGPEALVVRARDRELVLRQGRYGVTAEVRQIVHDVVISRREIGIDEWAHALAEELTAVADHDAAARAALGRLLGG